MPLFFKKEISRKYLYWHYSVYHHNVPASAIRNFNWKLIKNLVTGEIKLYNLKADIGETTDLSEAFPQKAKELSASLVQWYQKVSAELPVNNENYN